MASFVDARHRDLIPDAPQVCFCGTPRVLPPPRPMPSVAFGVQHISADAPYAYTDGTPNFIPPPPRGPFGLTLNGQAYPDTAPWSFTKGTPPFLPGNARNTGYTVFAYQHLDASPGSVPWAFTQSIVPQYNPKPPSRGSGVFASSGAEYDWSTPFVFTLSTAFVPTVGAISVPPSRSGFQRASGQWDASTDAPFLFAAGFATAPPRGPFGRAQGERHEPGDAAYVFTRNSPITSVAQAPAGGRAFGVQFEDGAAREVLVAGAGIVPPGPPVTARAYGQPQAADPAAFIWTYSRPAVSNVRPLPGAFAAIWTTDQSPFVWTRSTAPQVLVFRPTFRAFGEQHNADLAPFSFTTGFSPGAANIIILPPSMASQIFVPQLESGDAPFVWTRSLPLGSTIPAVAAEILSAAIFRLVNANLSVLVPFIYEASDTIPPGYVIRTIPDTGTQLVIWTPVAIVVSSGPAYPAGYGLPPNVVGLSAQAARDAIFAAGLSLDQNLWATSPVTAGFVIAQSLDPTIAVAPGRLMQLTLSRGPDKAPFPSPPIPPPQSS